eukprot:scaffold166593_cov32-Tisochrysis_lutea.AAC.2
MMRIPSAVESTGTHADFPPLHCLHHVCDSLLTLHGHGTLTTDSWFISGAGAVGDRPLRAAARGGCRQASWRWHHPTRRSARLLDGATCLTRCGGTATSVNANGWVVVALHEARHIVPRTADREHVAR